MCVEGKQCVFLGLQIGQKKGEGIMATVKIKGMTCNHCVMAVTKALNEIEGIKDVKVDLEKGEAFFEGKPADLGLDRRHGRRRH